MSRTETLAVPATARGVTVPRGTPERVLHARLAWVCVAIAVIGFTPSYWARVTTGTFTGPPVLHLHGLACTAWVVLCAVQAQLAVAGRLTRHRLFGMAGLALAAAVVFSGVLVVARVIEASVPFGASVAARTFSLLPLSLLVMFPVFVGLAIGWGRRADVHMRLMILATITILPPAFARMVRLVLAPERSAQAFGMAPPLSVATLPAVFVDLLIVGALVYDWRTRGRPHPVYVWGLAASVLVQVLRIPLAQTGAWHATADALVRLLLG